MAGFNIRISEWRKMFLQTFALVPRLAVAADADAGAVCDIDERNPADARGTKMRTLAQFHFLLWPLKVLNCMCVGKGLISKDSTLVFLP